MEPTEDVPYNVSDFATEDQEQDDDEDQSNDSRLVKALRTYLKNAIKDANTLDVLDLPKNATVGDKVAAFNEAAIHKGVVFHLRNLQQEIDNTIREN